MLAGCGGLRPGKKLGAKLNLSVHLKPDEDVPSSPLGTGDSRCCTLRSHGVPGLWQQNTAHSTPGHTGTPSTGLSKHAFMLL